METAHTNARKHGDSRISRSWYLTLLTGAHTLLLSLAIPLYGEPTTPSATPTPSVTTTESSLTTTPSKSMTFQQAVVSLLTGTAIVLQLIKKCHENLTKTATKQQTPSSTRTTTSTTGYTPSPRTKGHTPHTRTSNSCTQITTVAQASGAKDCGLHALANAASIDECLRQGKTLLSSNIKSYHPRFYQKGLNALHAEHRNHHLNNIGLYNDDIMLLAKKHFNMDNCCVLMRSNVLTAQGQAILGNRPDFTGDASNLESMLRTLQQKDSGTVHCVSLIDPGSKYKHWALISFVKERKNDRISTVYVDSCNQPYTSQPDAQACITFAQDRYLKQLA